MKLMMIRHAEAEHNTRPMVVAGRALDSPLTELGEHQAQSLGRDLASLSIDTIVYSPALRCKNTAEAISKFQTKKPKMVEDQKIVEMSQGVSTGMNKLALVLSPPNIFGLITEKLDFALPEGESFNLVAQRMNSAVVDYHEEGKTIVFITHGLAMRCWLAKQNDWSVFRLLLKKIKNTQIVEWL